MAASSVIPSLLLFLFVAAVAAASSNPNGYMHLRFYNHERILGSGPSATVVYAVQRRDSNSGAGFGNVIVYDNLLRSGVETDSPIVGRNQGMGVGSSLAENSGLTNFQLVFTAGKYNGSSLALQGLFPVAPLGTVFERAITGGTGKFRLARGYLLTTERSKMGQRTCRKKGASLGHSGYAAAAPAATVEVVKTLDTHGCRNQAKLGVGTTLLGGHKRAGLG
ncbi:hypothetical protein ZIOFF_004155 [Zingiber officinale]|uniref:Dirigent protein n=1 Tax=Zingiber officinale TaxID=94328 RepID=A0A8J5IV46_ZINOF|nr:hypothetical protein ZIOFF_004155 [Zingiber officinale]